MTASELCGSHTARLRGKQNQYSGNSVSHLSLSSTALPSWRKKTLILEEEIKGKRSRVEARKMVKMAWPFFKSLIWSIGEYDGKHSSRLTQLDVH